MTDCRGRARERYLFLFKARILVTKVRRVTDDRNLFLLKDIIKVIVGIDKVNFKIINTFFLMESKLPDVEVRVRQDEEPISFDFIHPDPRFVRYPLNLRCAGDRSVHDDWLKEIRNYAADASQYFIID